MTKANVTGKDSDFGHWLRHEPQLDSSKGFRATDLDLLWYCADGIETAGLYMLIEEKCRMREMDTWQARRFQILDQNCQADPYYRGFHLIQFEGTNPTDGKTFWNHQEITVADLIDYLAFRKTPPKKSKIAN